MRFLIVTQFFPPELGAAPTRLAAQTRELLRLGHQVEIVTALPSYGRTQIFPGYRGRFYMRDSWKGCTVHRFWLYASQGRGFGRSASYLSFMLITLIGIFKAERPDFIFVNSAPLILMVPAYCASRRWGALVIMNIADLYVKSLAHLGVIRNAGLLGLLKAFERWCYGKADIITVASEGIRQEIIAHDRVPPEKITFLPNGVDGELFRPRPPDQALLKKYGLEGKLVFVYPGTHGYAHALEYVLDAAKMLLSDQRVHFMFIGSGSEKARLVKKAADEGITNITFLDSLPLPELADHLSLAYCGLVHQKNSPLANETRPAKSYPVMAMGKPVLFAGFGEGAEIIRKHQAGVVIAPEQPELLMATVLQLIDDRAHLEQLGRNGRRLVEAEFSWRAIVGSWLDELLLLTSGERPSVTAHRAMRARMPWRAKRR